MRHLGENGIMSRIYELPIHLRKFYRDNFGYKGGELPATEKLADHVLSLPMYPDLTQDEMDYILDRVAEFFSMR